MDKKAAWIMDWSRKLRKLFPFIEILIIEQEIVELFEKKRKGGRK